MGLTPEITVLEVLVHLNGGDWLRAGEQLGLVLPSVVVPQARNVLLNPLHPAMARLFWCIRSPSSWMRGCGDVIFPEVAVQEGSCRGWRALGADLLVTLNRQAAALLQDCGESVPVL